MDDAVQYYSTFFPETSFPSVKLRVAVWFVMWIDTGLSPVAISSSIKIYFCKYIQNDAWIDYC